MKRLLFLSHRLPYPPNKGDKIRSFHQLKALARDYRIDLITFVDYKEDRKYKSELNSYCQNVFIFNLNKFTGLFMSTIFFLLGKSLSEGYYFNFTTYFRIRSLLKKNNYDAVFCFSAQVAQYVLKYNQSKRIMDFVDVDSDKWRQYSIQKMFPLNIIYKYESNRLLKFEKKISASFSLSLFSTIPECNLYKSYGANGRIDVINNGVDYNFFCPIPAVKEKAIIFVGAMDYFPNVDAVTWFVDNVFLSLTEKVKDLRFYIVGSNPGDEVLKLENLSDNIIVTGFVDDIRPYLAKSKLAVMPIRIARGIQNKILEAMSMELPVVINEKLFESLSNLDRKSVFIYKDNSDLSAIIDNNIANDEKLTLKGKELRKYVMANYDWDKNLNQLKTLISDC